MCSQRRTGRVWRAGPARIPLAFAAALAACSPPAAPPLESPPAGGFAFALLGDAPYSERDERRLDAAIERINETRELRFVLHAGDIKGGTEPCTDVLLQRRLAQIGRIAKPVLLTPGDNEWTDCHRAGAGRFLPTERLERLRALGWSEPRATLGTAPAIRLEIQANDPAFRDYPENAIFVHDRVLIAAAHVVGSENGLAPWDGLAAPDSAAAPRADRLAEFRHRQAAALAWIDTAFSRARREGHVAVVLLMHANLLLEKPPEASARVGFNAIVTRLREQAVAYGGPVLLAHGDFHLFRFDRPFAEPGDGGPAAPNVQRVETPGHPAVGWVAVRFVPGKDDGPFHFELNTVP
jgi:hypothetical protein